MFLTRMGFGSKAVVTGDITQMDLPRQQLSGLRHAIDVLRGVEGVAFTFFTSRDVVRHPLVQRIVAGVRAQHRRRGRAGHVMAKHAKSAGCPLRSRSNCSLRHAGRGRRVPVTLRTLGPGGAGRGQARQAASAAAAPESARAARPAAKAGYAVCIRVVGKAESRRLNLHVARQGQAHQRALVSRRPPAERAESGALGRSRRSARRWWPGRRGSRASRWRRTGPTWSSTARCTCSATITSRRDAARRMESARSGNPAWFGVS